MYNNKQPLFFGIDGGGTKCKTILVSGNISLSEYKILGSGISGTANPLHGFEQATNSIVESAMLALQDAGLEHIPLSDITAGAGLAGLNLPSLYGQMSAWQSPFKQMLLATDTLTACLGAHQGKEGAVIITGTGSCGFSYIEGCETIIGGHGFPQGDKASGACFGLQGVSQVLLSLEGLLAPTMMNETLLDKLNCDNAIALVEKIAGKPATFYAQLANLVFTAAEQGDKVARDIVAEGAKYINTLAQVLWNKSPQRMSMIGGLSASIMPWLAEDIQDKLSEPLCPPEVGAVLFAQQSLYDKEINKLAGALIN